MVQTTSTSGSPCSDERLCARSFVSRRHSVSRIPARIEISARPLWLPTERHQPIALPVHRGYEFEVPAIPVPTFEETLAEKLAAWRRRRKLRDLYDLDVSGRGTLDEPLIRRLLVLKVWYDVVEDRLGDAPFDPSAIIGDFDVRQLLSEDIGLLTQPVDAPAWLAHVPDRYRFVVDLDDTETRIARCSPADRHFVEETIADLLQG